MQSLPEPVVEPSPNFGTEAGRDRTIGDYPPEQSRQVNTHLCVSSCIQFNAEYVTPE